MCTQVVHSFDTTTLDSQWAPPSPLWRGLYLESLIGRGLERVPGVRCDKRSGAAPLVSRLVSRIPRAPHEPGVNGHRKWQGFGHRKCQDPSAAPRRERSDRSGAASREQSAGGRKKPRPIGSSPRLRGTEGPARNRTRWNLVKSRRSGKRHAEFPWRLALQTTRWLRANS